MNTLFCNLQTFLVKMESFLGYTIGIGHLHSHNAFKCVCIFWSRQKLSFQENFGFFLNENLKNDRDKKTRKIDFCFLGKVRKFIGSSIHRKDAIIVVFTINFMVFQFKIQFLVFYLIFFCFVFLGALGYRLILLC